MLKYSKYNIFSRFRNSDKFFILNLLSGNADILSSSEAEKLDVIRNNSNSPDDEFAAELAGKGYLAEQEEEEAIYRRKYLDFIDSRNKEEVQLFFITNYSCNFSCNYCYQDQYNIQDQELSKEVIDAFFRYIRNEFAAREKYITLFGGEPLLGSAKHKSLITYFIEKANEAELNLCLVTNGYNLPDYIDILKLGKIREVQITLDGTESVHNSRRHLKGGGATFKKIVEGITLCLNNKIPVNLRMVIDKENIKDLSNIAKFAIEKGWTEKALFKTQIGRNYELHHCQSSSEKLFNRISLFEKLYEIINANPHVLEFFKPSFSVSRFLSENGVLPESLFDSCPACKTEWAFDYTGKIYPCTATAGKLDESVGTFYPSINLVSEQIDEWESRDVISIPGCRDCNLQLACGGGCGSIAKNRTGKIFSTDCRPVKELLELGFSAYFDQDMKK